MAIDCCIILITLLFPPVGVAIVYGCGADLCINMYVSLLITKYLHNRLTSLFYFSCLTILGYLPGKKKPSQAKKAKQITKQLL